MEIREVFARNLRKLRQAKGLSQEALADEAGIDRTYVSALERGVYSASITTIAKLATVLGVEPAAFLQRPSRSGRSKT
jgi:transcriptional regulator with XRE-family HTH domain